MRESDNNNRRGFMKTTKVNVLLAGLLLMLLFSASVSYTAESPAIDSTPVAVMPETAFEFPSTIEGESLTHDFLIQNRGSAPLTIKEVKTT
jgi:hypothetical protein